jgi:hypothetical protein
MADDLKQLNKSVTEAVNILKVYFGNSAQIKNMNDKQREAISKWFDVVTEEEAQQKKQRAFSERERDEHGRFFKKQDKMIDEQTSKFIGMASSVGGMFKSMTKKQDKMLDEQTSKFMGMASSIGGMFKSMTTIVGSTLKDTGSSVINNLKGLFSQIKSQFLGLFGEESEWFGILGSIKDSIKGFAKGFTAIFRRPFGAVTKILKNIYKLQVKQMKMDFLDAGGKDKKKKVSWGGLIGAFLFIVGSAFGAFIHRYLILMTKLPIFGKIARMFTKIESIPFIGKLFKAVKFGFKWLGWPLTLILSVIDFIKGFRDTEGSLWEKIKGGLWKALEGFIELPVRFVGWVIEKVLGWFGVEVDGVGDKMMKIIKKGFFMILDGWTLIFSLVKDSIKSLLSTQWVKKILGVIGSILSNVYNFFIDLWNSAIKWISSKIAKFGWLGEGAAKGVSLMSLNRIETPTSSPVEAVAQTEKMKIENKKKGDKELTDALNTLGDKVIGSNRRTGDLIAASVQGGSNVNSGGGSDTQQIPDELDNTLVSVNNYGGGNE